jgi:hypothetical protein
LNTMNSRYEYIDEELECLCTEGTALAELGERHDKYTKERKLFEWEGGKPIVVTIRNKKGCLYMILPEDDEKYELRYHASGKYEYGKRKSVRFYKSNKNSPDVRPSKGSTQPNSKTSKATREALEILSKNGKYNKKQLKEKYSEVEVDEFSMLKSILLKYTKKIDKDYGLFSDCSIDIHDYISEYIEKSSKKSYSLKKAENDFDEYAMYYSIPPEKPKKKKKSKKQSDSETSDSDTTSTTSIESKVLVVKNRPVIRGRAKEVNVSKNIKNVIKNKKNISEAVSSKPVLKNRGIYFPK